MRRVHKVVLVEDNHVLTRGLFCEGPSVVDREPIVRSVGILLAFLEGSEIIVCLSAWAFNELPRSAP